MDGCWLNTHNRILTLPELYSTLGDHTALCIIQLIPSKPPFERGYQRCHLEIEETQAQRVELSAQVYTVSNGQRWGNSEAVWLWSLCYCPLPASLPASPHWVVMK